MEEGYPFEERGKFTRAKTDLNVLRFPEFFDCARHVSLTGQLADTRWRPMGVCQRRGRELFSKLIYTC